LVRGSSGAVEVVLEDASRGDPHLEGGEGSSRGGAGTEAEEQ